MTYGEHLKKGVERARAAALANERIDEILNEFRRDVGAASGKSLQLQKGVIQERADRPSIGNRSGIVPSWVTDSQELILGASPTRVVLCLVSRSVDGFPVELVYADQVAWCRSEDDLKLGLSKMLENPKIAALLQPEALVASK